MKPFDIEKAKQGAPVVTKAGLDVEIISFDASGLYPIRAKWGCFVHSYTREGNFFMNYESDDDLMLKNN